jgi:phage host-nuclease inhibitor protein Gam
MEANARTTLAKITANLRQVNPNCESMVSTVSDLAVEAGRLRLFARDQPADPFLRTNPKAYKIRAELESLESALQKRDAPKALEHAEAALRVLDA